MAIKIILASKSPRRKEILSMLNIDFDVLVSEMDEIIRYTQKEEIVKDLAYQKAKIIFDKIKDDTIVIGSDTIVCIGDKILGKPKDRLDAIRQLKLLNGSTHIVATGLAVLSRIDGKIRKAILCDKASVTFDTLTNEEIEKYVDTNEPMDKAGSYAVQGKGAKFIKKINGNFYTVMGLPINKLYKVLKNLGCFK